MLNIRRLLGISADASFRRISTIVSTKEISFTDIDRFGGCLQHFLTKIYIFAGISDFGGSFRQKSWPFQRVSAIIPSKQRVFAHLGYFGGTSKQNSYSLSGFGDLSGTSRQFKQRSYFRRTFCNRPKLRSRFCLSWLFSREC